MGGGRNSGPLNDNPYQPPTDTEREDAPRAHHTATLQRQSVALLVVLTIVTLGIYAIFWLVKTTRTVNARVERGISQAFVGTAIVACAASYAIAVISSVVSGTWAADWEALDRMTGIAQGALTLIWVFRVRRCLNVSTGARPGMRTWANGFFTFLFQQFYLQHVINVIVAREARRAMVQAG